MNSFVFSFFRVFVMEFTPDDGSAVMAISVPCPGCEKNLNFDDELAGQWIKCPGCDQVLLVPPTPTPGPNVTRDFILNSSPID